MQLCFNKCKCKNPSPQKKWEMHSQSVCLCVPPQKTQPRQTVYRSMPPKTSKNKMPKPKHALSPTYTQTTLKMSKAIQPKDRTMLGSPWTCLEIFPCQLRSHVRHCESDVPKAGHSLTQNQQSPRLHIFRKSWGNTMKITHSCDFLSCIDSLIVWRTTWVSSRNGRR